MARKVHPIAFGLILVLHCALMGIALAIKTVANVLNFFAEGISFCWAKYCAFHLKIVSK